MTITRNTKYEIGDKLWVWDSGVTINCTVSCIYYSCTTWKNKNGEVKSSIEEKYTVEYEHYSGSELRCYAGELFRTREELIEHLDRKYK